MAKTEDKCLLVKIIFAILGAISGISIFGSFAGLKNANAAAWGLISAIFAILVIRLHIAYRRNVLHLRYTPRKLRILMNFGAFGTFASILAAIVYFSLAVILKQGYKMREDGYIPAGIFALLSMKWTITYFCYSRKYLKIITPDNEILPVA